MPLWLAWAACLLCPTFASVTYKLIWGLFAKIHDESGALFLLFDFDFFLLASASASSWTCADGALLQKPPAMLNYLQHFAQPVEIFRETLLAYGFTGFTWLAEVKP